MAHGLVILELKSMQVAAGARSPLTSSSTDALSGEVLSTSAALPDEVGERDRRPLEVLYVRAEGPFGEPY